jgi:hypothetical protein
MRNDPIHRDAPETSGSDGPDAPSFKCDDGTTVLQQAQSAVASRRFCGSRRR